MAWREKSILEDRYEFVLLATVEGANIAELCRRFDVSRETGYMWIARFKSQGRAGLTNVSRRPHSSPDRTDPEIVKKILELRDSHPAWGGRKLRARLVALGEQGIPAPSTITSILRKNQRLGDLDSQKHRAWRRFERQRPNELWQMDFKGHVPMHVGRRCHPLTVLDDYSRFSIALRACDNERAPTVQSHLTAIFRRYGLPEQILCDNGPPWAMPGGALFHTALTVWLLRIGVTVIHGRPHHPQTQGKEERFHRTLNAELLSRQELRDIEHAQQEFDIWRDIYNLERPNEAIGLAVPSSKYKASERAYPEKLPALEYSEEDKVLKVISDGSLTYKNSWLYIGIAFAGQNVGVRTNNKEDVEVRYGPHVIDTFERSSLKSRRSRRHPTLETSLPIDS